MKKLIVAFILGGIIFGSIGVYASNYLASDISYQPSDESWEVSNVNDAINDLYNAKIELNDLKTLGDATANDILLGKTAVVNGELITGENNGGSKIISLGTGTSFNVTSYSGYENFTVDDFIIEPISSSYDYGWYNDGSETCKGYKYASVTVTKSYSNGILTASVTGNGSISKGDNGTFNASMSSTSSVKAYLIIN